MQHLKDFGLFLNEAVSQEEQKDLFNKGKKISGIIEKIAEHQEKIAELYDQLKELMKGDENLEPIAKDVEVAAAKAKEEEKEARELEDKFEKVKKEYKPRPGSASEAILKYLESADEATMPELMRKFGGGPWKRTDGQPVWNNATVVSSVEYLLDKGKIKVENKRNPATNRMANFYSIA
jgi:predicted nuclease with TOPRIM domain